jgi:hypothetical protein
MMPYRNSTPALPPKPGRLKTFLARLLFLPGEWRIQKGRWVWVCYRPRWPGDDAPFTP